MYLRKVTNRKTGRTYLSIVQSYWDRNKTQSETVDVKSLGYLNSLKIKYDDLLAFFTAEDMEIKINLFATLRGKRGK